MSKYKQFIDMKAGNLLPLIADANAFNEVINELTKPLMDLPANTVVSIEATGFIFGGAVANCLNTGFLPVRKAGKFKGDTYKTPTFVDSSKKEKQLEIAKTMIKSHDKVILIDDWVQSASQLLATIDLLENIEVEILAIGVVLDESTDQMRERLSKLNYHFVIDYRTCW